MKMLKSALITAFILLAVIPAVPGSNYAMAGTMTMTKTGDGIRTTLMIDRSKGTIDLYLTDLKVQKPIAEAKVRAVVVLPNGIKVEKELMGMKMSEDFVFMNTVDMSVKGRYILDIKVETVKKASVFSFSYNVD